MNQSKFPNKLIENLKRKYTILKTTSRVNTHLRNLQEEFLEDVDKIHKILHQTDNNSLKR